MNKGLFLDRDGVVNQEINYLHRIEDVVFIDGIFEICRFYQKNGFQLFIITNQAGIAKGYYKEEDFWSLTAWMNEEFKKKGIVITKVYHCPHHPNFTGDCNCRKPNPGMILKARQEFDLDLSRSILIGDKLSDIEAGQNAGIQDNFYIEELLKKINNLPLPE
ncbi:MAG TPA: HAD family hydrolase [Prolixibacteraceae bacterium]|nr:HAD family hydrolase [Prolixibacteraceae bacterium]